MKRVFAIAALIAIFGGLVAGGLALQNPLLRHDLAQLPGKVDARGPAAVREFARSVELTPRPYVIKPEPLRLNVLTGEYDLTLRRYVSTNERIVDGASLTFWFPRRFVLVNFAARDGTFDEAPISFDYDTSLPPECGRDCKKNVAASVSFSPRRIPSLPSDAQIAEAAAMPAGQLTRRMMPDRIYALDESHCGFSLYDTDAFRSEGLPYPFDRARLFRRDAQDGEALTVACVVDGGGNCSAAADYELGARVQVSFPRALLCETDEVLRRARKIFDDHLMARTDKTPGSGDVTQ